MERLELECDADEAQVPRGAGESARDSEPSVRLPPKYAVERLLGRGGMGVVVEARHTQLGHRVAIKVLGQELRAHPQLVARFDREARAAGALSSPHAVKIFDVDKTAEGIPFMVMELLDGSDLGQLLDERGPMPVAQSVRWIVEACDAIAEAHSLGIIHRDLKPSNLFLERESGAIKVLDFGIAKRIASTEAALTAGIVPLGTPQYMSPEQVRCAKDLDARTDIWSLGVTLYELVCGRPPYDHDIPQACIVAIVTEPVPDPCSLRADLPRALGDVILRALAKEPGERFASAEELVRALAPFADAATADAHVEDDAPPAQAEAPPRRRPRAHVRGATAIACVASALVLGGFVRRPHDETLARAATSSPALAGAYARTGDVLADTTPVVPAEPSPPEDPEAAQPARSRAVRSAPASRARGAARTPTPEARSMIVHGGISGPGF